VRETLFNWLGQTLDGQRCLDLFAGSGALGLEAASRGAARVVLVDNSAPAVAAMLDNLRTLGRLPGGEVEVLRSDALQFAARGSGSQQRFDVIFIDPPYRQGWWPKVQPCLDSLSNDGARVYAEAEVVLEAWPGWTLVREGRAGQVFHHLFEKDSSHAE
jgi:16S rRNA (guanine966-N2)-methyltransferase